MNGRRSQVVLAGMAAGGAKAQFNPVQAQKLFFIFDRVIPDKIDGPHFAFAPCHFAHSTKTFTANCTPCAVPAKSRSITQGGIRATRSPKRVSDWGKRR